MKSHSASTTPNHRHTGPYTSQHLSEFRSDPHREYREPEEAEQDPVAVNVRGQQHEQQAPRQHDAQQLLEQHQHQHSQTHSESPGSTPQYQPLSTTDPLKHRQPSLPPSLSPSHSAVDQSKQVQFQVATPAASNQKLRLGHHRISSQSHSPETQPKKLDKTLPSDDTQNRSPPLSELPALSFSHPVPSDTAYSIPFAVSSIDCGLPLISNTLPTTALSQKRQSSLSNYIVTSKRAQNMSQGHTHNQNQNMPSHHNMSNQRNQAIQYPGQPQQNQNQQTQNQQIQNQQLQKGQIINHFQQSLPNQQLNTQLASSNDYPYAASPHAASPQVYTASPIPSNGPSPRNTSLPAQNMRTVRRIPNQTGVNKNTPTPTTVYDLPSSPANQGQNSNSSESNVPVESEANAQASYQQYQYQQFLQQQQQVQQAQQAHVQAQAEADAAQAAQAAAQAAQRAMSDEEQQLATKLKETYKNIVNFEELVQKHCIDITVKINQINGYGGNTGYSIGTSVNGANTSPTSELSNDLWTVYHHNVTLLDNYNDFLVTALKPSSNQTHFKTGKNIVDLYKIPRRMWVYGIVGYLEVLKNIMGIFQDHEICSCFISHCFNIVSNLTDPALEMEGWWSEKLGDLSRMAIALYSSKFIDWKISAEFWYSVAMKTLYGHGKIYYHMCTVQQDNLDALVNIGKSVVCRDPFVPTQQYLRLVVENICTQRNVLSLLELPIIDFIKIHKVLLSIFNSSGSNPGGGALAGAIAPSGGISSVGNVSGISGTPIGSGSGTPGIYQPSNYGSSDPQLQYGINLVTRYGLTFGSDATGYNFFTRELYTPSGITPINDPSHPYFHPGKPILHSTEKFNFWFNKGSLFALANINHLIGFGDPKNPFAKIFLLPEALRERKDKKDRKRKSRDDKNSDMGGAPFAGGAAELSSPDWFYSLQHINKSVLELSIRILNHYLIGPKQASTSHVIVWLYFLIAVGEATKKFPQSQPMFDWLFRKLFPWESFINYLNNLLSIVRGSDRLRARSAYLCNFDYLKHFSENETLPEVWKCWGTLWFDTIVEKGDYVDLDASGVKDSNMFDMPVCGAYPMSDYGNSNGAANGIGDQKSTFKMESENDERVVRIILLARLLADNYSFGLVRTTDSFKYDENVYRSDAGRDPYMEEFLLGDGRFVQNGFLQAITFGNLCIGGSSGEEDSIWFGSAGAVTAESQYMYQNSQNSQNQSQQSRQSQSGQLIQQHEQLGLLGSTVALCGDLGDRMDSSLTRITLDTNIWLKHCGRIFKCVRNGVFKISIPLIVFQELRTLRKSSEATISDAATRSVIIIRELYFAKEIVPLRFDGTVASDINETFEFENSSNWRSNVDETILNCVNEHDELGRKQMIGADSIISAKNPTVPGSGFHHDTIMISPSEEVPVETVLTAQTSKMFRYCILITDDRNMRLRAKAIGLTSFQSRWLFTQLESLFPFRCID